MIASPRLAPARPARPSEVRLATPAASSRPAGRERHIGQLDGWRGISIACVLAAHMFPLGPKGWHLNETVAPAGMALFFTLSGFLITSFLLARPEPVNFLIRRGCRILPLAVAYLVCVLVVTGAGPEAWAANLFFVTNYEPQYLFLWNTPFWSLCVEVHFYLFVAAAVALGGRRALWLLPVACGAVTFGRVATDTPISNYTHLRGDEILAGACLALWQSAGPAAGGVLLRAVSPWAWAGLLLAASSPFGGPVQFARPYAAALLVGSTLVQNRHWVSRQLHRPGLKYLATISFALYILHPATYRGWMDEGSAAVRYLVKRPVSLAVLAALAHLSTVTWEKWWIARGKQWTAGRATGCPRTDRRMLFYALFAVAFFGTLSAGQRGGVRTAVAAGWLGVAFLMPFWVQLGLGSMIADLRTAAAVAVVLAAVADPAGARLRPTLTDGLHAGVVLAQILTECQLGSFRPLTLPEIARKWVAPYLMGRLLLGGGGDLARVLPGIGKVAVALAALAVGEAVLQVNFVNTALGRTFGLLEAGEGYRWGMKRAHVTFDHPIFFGMALVLLLPWGMEAARRAWAGEGPRWWRWLPAVVAAALFATVSRGPQIAAMATAGIYFFFRVPKIRVPAVLVVVVGGGVAYTFKDQLVDLLAVVAGEKSADAEVRLVTIDGEEYEYTGTNHRVLLFKAYAGPIENAGWIGYGKEMLGVELDEALAMRFASIDCHYLLFYLQYGRLGLGAFLILTAGVLLTLGRAALRRDAPQAPLAAGLLGGLLSVAVLLMSVWFSPDFAGIWLFSAGVAGGLPYLKVSPTGLPPAAETSVPVEPKPDLRPAPAYAPVRPPVPVRAHADTPPRPPADR